jgi:ABC-2 type transport system permease protein
MNKIWLVFKYEYSRHVLRKRFLIALISMPLFMAVIMGASIISSLTSIDSAPVGYIIETSILNDFQPETPQEGFLNSDVKFVPYHSESSADQDLNRGIIQAYFVISPDYDQTANARLVYLKYPGMRVEEQFQSQIRKSLLKTQPAEIVSRLTQGYNLTLISADGSRRVGENDWINMVILFTSGILFIVVLFTSSGYLMSALVEEKENRTMEIVVTSVSTNQLMAGKVVGNLSVGLTQMLVWVSAIIVAYLLGRSQLTWLQSIHISLAEILSLAAIMLPSFVLVAALMAMIGSTVTESREAQQMVGLINLPVVAPYWLATPLIMNPNGDLAVALSFFPLTAPVTMSIRIAMTVVPYWQVLLSSIILILSAAGAIWLSARAYRLGMVRYGKKVAFKELFGRLGVKHA